MATTTSQKPFAHGRVLKLTDLGALPEALRGAVRTWLNDNFGSETDFACELRDLPNGGLSVTDEGGDTSAEDFDLHELIDEAGNLAFLAALFTPLGEGSIFDRQGQIAGLAIEGRLREVNPKYDDFAPQWSRLLPGIQPLADEAASALASPLVGPKNEAEWRALFPGRAAQRTIDVIVERLRKARDSGGSAQHSRFERDTKVLLDQQPRDSFEWLVASKTLLLTYADPFDDLVLEEIGPLSVFVALTDLSLSVSPETDLTALSQLAQLRTLSVKGGEGSDWGWLASLRQLEELAVAKSDDATHPPHFAIRDNPKLRALDWSGDSLNLAPLGGSQSLRELHLLGEVADLNPLREFLLLQELYVSQNDVSDIGPLLDLRKLQVLELSQNRLTSLEGIERLPKLESLAAEWNCISDFAPVERWLSSEPERAADWIEEHASSQLDLTSAAGQALKDDWYNLDKWRALAEQLAADEHLLADEVRLRLENDGDCSLPFRWGRSSNVPSPDWE